jgi:hypothetical protein
MNNFLGDLLIAYIDGKRWRVVEGFTYRLCQPDGVQYVSIPRGFITDFASFPLGIVFKSPGGRWDKAAVVHDVLYKTGVVSVDGRSAGRSDPRPITRGEADAIFKEAMTVAGVGWFPKQIIYAGVRVGGWKAWNAHRKAEADANRSAVA